MASPLQSHDSKLQPKNIKSDTLFHEHKNQLKRRK